MKSRMSRRRSRRMTRCGGAVETSRRDCRRNRNFLPTTPSCRQNSRWMPPSSDAPYLLPNCRQRIHLRCRRRSRTMSPRTDQSSPHGHRWERQARSWRRRRCTRAKIDGSAWQDSSCEGLAERVHALGGGWVAANITPPRESACGTTLRRQMHVFTVAFRKLRLAVRADTWDRLPPELTTTTPAA